MIDARAFADSGLQKFALPPGARLLGELAFSGCRDLVSVDVGQGLVEVGPLCFLGTAVK